MLAVNIRRWKARALTQKLVLIKMRILFPFLPFLLVCEKEDQLSFLIGAIVFELERALSASNINREHDIHSGIDNYGCGRFPHFIEPAVVIALTDSSAATSMKEDFQVD